MSTENIFQFDINYRLIVTYLMSCIEIISDTSTLNHIMGAGLHILFSILIYIFLQTIMVQDLNINTFSDRDALL